MADTPPPVDRTSRPAPGRAWRFVELVVLSALAAGGAFWAARQITAHHTVVVETPSAWIGQFKK